MQASFSAQPSEPGPQGRPFEAEWALSRSIYGVRPKLYEAPGRRNHDAERRATKFANPRRLPVSTGYHRRQRFCRPVGRMVTA